MPSSVRPGEIENPKVGDSVVSRCGIIKVSLAADGSFPVTKLSKKRGSFNIQLYFEGKQEPDTVIFRTEDPAIPLYRLDPTAKLVKVKIVTNPV
jgi:hypothetical protein